MKSLVTYFSASGVTAEKLKPYIDGAEIVDARVVKSVIDAKGWVERISI